MFGLFRKKKQATPKVSDHWCPSGKHGVLVTGLGAMGDAIICLDCGREKYEEHWSFDEARRAIEITDALRASVMAARELPGGINARLNEPDPEFERWLRAGPNGHVWGPLPEDE